VAQINPNGEPDARNYHCEFCGAEQVYGAAELLVHLA
jgi:hypothetical protein